jgi:hypothetical protein
VQELRASGSNWPEVNRLPRPRPVHITPLVDGLPCHRQVSHASRRTDALNASKPVEIANAVVVRGGQQVRLPVTFQERRRPK